MKRIVLLIAYTLCVSPALRAEAATTPFVAALRVKVAENEPLRRNDSLVQTFYVYRPKGADAPMLIYWPEARYLLRLENYEEADPSWDAIAQLTKYVDLERDVVASRESIGSSTYLETAAGVIGDIEKCLTGRRIIFETPTKPDFGPLNVTVVRVKPQALRYDNGRFECVYDVAELRVTSAGPLADQIIPVAIPTKGMALYKNVVKSGEMRMRVENWEKLATPGRTLKVTADVKSYLKAKREDAPFAVIYASLSDIEQL